MVQLVKCPICDGISSQMREHCPYCGARRKFIASHSFERYQIIIKAETIHLDAERGIFYPLEIVRAFSTTFCSDERAQLAGVDSE